MQQLKADYGGGLSQIQKDLSVVLEAGESQLFTQTQPDPVPPVSSAAAAEAAPAAAPVKAISADEPAVSPKAVQLSSRPKIILPERYQSRSRSRAAAGSASDTSDKGNAAIGNATSNHASNTAAKRPRIDTSRFGR